MTLTPARQGCLDALPLFIPALPFAFVFGVVVAEAGIPQWLGWSSSPIIFGGAIQVTLLTCLLYTSPSPRDRTRSRMPSSA